jgi:hypothetical protein
MFHHRSSSQHSEMQPQRIEYNKRITFMAMSVRYIYIIVTVAVVTLLRDFWPYGLRD